MVISISSPLMVGIYENNNLIKAYTSNERTSEELPKIIKDILNTFTCKGIYFVKGPGSFMAIKITYIFLRTLSISKECPLYACDGFEFNGNSPISAMGKLYFIKENGKILTKVFSDIQSYPFELPKVLDKDSFSDDTKPLYILPAV